MNSNRGTIIALVIAIGVAIFALIQQQTAFNDLRVAVTKAARAESARVTAVSMMQEAVGTQVQAEVGQATALAAAGEASTAQATAQAAARTAAVQINDVGTRSADTLATSSADAANAQATSTAQADILSTIQAEATAEVFSLQEQVDTAATNQADTLNLLGTATAQIDLAEFARAAAEEDRSSALAQLWDISTAQAEMRGDLATAQVMMTGAPPTLVPSPTVPPRPTETADDSTPVANTTADLTNTFTSTDEKITVNYPQDWFAQEYQNGAVIIVNQEDLFNRAESALQTGQIEVDIIVGRYEDFGLTGLTDPEVLLNEIINNILSRQSTFTADTVRTLTVNDHPAAQVFANDGNNDLTIYTIQLSDTALSVVYGITANREGQESVDTIFNIASSITFTE